MFLSLQTLTSIIRTCLPILVKLTDLANSAIIFLSHMTLCTWLTFLLGSQTVIFIVLLFWIYLIFLMLVFVLQWISLHLEILITLLSQFPLTFHRIAYDIAYDYSCADWDGLRDHLRDVSWEDIFKPSASAAASELCEWVHVGIDVYICHRKYQVKPHSSRRFSAACAAAIVHESQFFRLYQKHKFPDSKVKFRQASNNCKRVLEAAKPAYANKTRESITS